MTHNVPISVITELHRYVHHHCPTGDFLRAVLENNLTESFARADDHNLPKMYEIVKYVYNEIPALCHGSEERVRNWLDGRRNLE